MCLVIPETVNMKKNGEKVKGSVNIEPKRIVANKIRCTGSMLCLNVKKSKINPQRKPVVYISIINPFVCPRSVTKGVEILKVFKRAVS